MIWGINTTRLTLLVLASGLFFLLLSFFLIVFQPTIYLSLSLFFCYLVVGYFLSLVSLRKVYYLLAVLLPFSLKQGIGNSGFTVQFPSEPLIGLLAIALVFKWILTGFENTKFLTHPITLLLLLYLTFSGISVAFSTLPLISVKAYVVRITYILVFYFGVYDIFNKQISKNKVILITDIITNIRLQLITLDYI